MGEAQGIERVFWIQLPNTGVNPGQDCRDSLGPPIYQLEWLRLKGWFFHGGDTLRASIGISGMEGREIGVAFDSLDSKMGIMEAWVSNPIGESCIQSLVFAFPIEIDSIPEPPDSGLLVEYYDNQDFTSLFDAIPDSTINKIWGSGVPLPGMGNDTFSVRWVGGLRAPVTGTYRICPEICNGGVRFWLSGTLLHDFTAGSNCGELCKPVNLIADQVNDIVLEYWHTTGDAVCRLRWLTPSGGDQYIPASVYR